MEGESKRIMQLKCALVLNKFLEENKVRRTLNHNSRIQDFTIVDNLSKLSSASGLRTATISSIFNADSVPSITTIILLLEKLQKTVSDFGQSYDLLNDDEIRNFEAELIRKKTIEKIKKSSRKEI